MDEISELEFLLARYVTRFNEVVPEFAKTLSEENICSILQNCLRDGKKLSELPEVEILQLQYRAKFDEPLSYNFMTIHTEEELVTALRDCLSSGKPYELPDDVKHLVEQGAVF